MEQARCQRRWWSAAALGGAPLLRLDGDVVDHGGDAVDCLSRGTDLPAVLFARSVAAERDDLMIDGDVDGERLARDRLRDLAADFGLDHFVIPLLGRGAVHRTARHRKQDQNRNENGDTTLHRNLLLRFAAVAMAIPVSDGPRVLKSS